MTAFAAPSYRDSASAEPGDAKAAFFAVLLAILVCVQGIRVADIPVPFALFFSLFYLLRFQPPIPAAAPRIYTIIICYLLVVSTRNALSSTGTLRDFLYIGICLANLCITITLFDLFEAIGARTVALGLLIVALCETVLQLLEFLNLGGFNGLMAPILRFWAAQTNSESFLLPGALTQRAPGSFGSPTSAGLVLYLIIRGAAIALRRRPMIYLGIVPIIIGGARTALIIFVLWEILAQVLLHWRRNFKVAMTLMTCLSGATLAFIAYPRLIDHVFVFRSFAAPTQLAQGISVVNRLRSFQWALQHWSQFLTLGGITSADLTSRIAWQGSGIDSELILRSLQFGFVGFLCLLVSNLWTGFSWKNQDFWFIVFFGMIASLSNAMLTDFVLFPFVIIYCLCVRLTGTGSSSKATPLTQTICADGPTDFTQDFNPS